MQTADDIIARGQQVRQANRAEIVTQRRAGSGGGTLKGAHAGRANNVNAARSVRYTFFGSGSVQQFKHQRAHRIDARITRTHQGDVLALASLL